jgi:hypothetical protein
MGEHATRVVVSHPDELSDWGRQQLYADRFRRYLRRVHDDVAVGDEWAEFLDVGCCGSTLDLALRVEAVDGPGRIGPDTSVEFVERDETMAGGWTVQSAAGPTDRE